MPSSGVIGFGHYISRRMALVVFRRCHPLVWCMLHGRKAGRATGLWSRANLAQKGHRKVVIVFSEWVAALAQHACQC